LTYYIFLTITMSVPLLEIRHYNILKKFYIKYEIDVYYAKSGEKLKIRYERLYGISFGLYYNLRFYCFLIIQRIQYCYSVYL